MRNDLDRITCTTENWSEDPFYSHSVVNSCSFTEFKQLSENDVLVMVDLSAAFGTINILDSSSTKRFWNNWYSSKMGGIIHRQLGYESTDWKLKIWGSSGLMCWAGAITMYSSAEPHGKKYPASLYGYGYHKISFQIQARNLHKESMQQLDSCLDDIISWMTKF